MTNTQMVELYDLYPNIQGEKWYTPNYSFFIPIYKKVFEMIKCLWFDLKMNLIRSIV